MSELAVEAPRVHDFEDMFENAPCGYVILLPNGRVERVNKTLLEWTGHSADEMLNKRFSDFLNMAGRIYFETQHRLLRMQGFFSEFAIDMVTAHGKPLQMIVNATRAETRRAKRCLCGLR